MTREIPSNKVAIFTQGIIIVVIASVVGVTVEYMGWLKSSALGRLAANTSVPVLGLVIFMVGLVIAIVSGIDSWAFKIQIDATGIGVSDRLGQYWIPYANIAALKLIPAYGAGIALKDRDLWLNGFVGSVGNRSKLDQMSAVLKATYGCDIAILNKCLKCGAKEFLKIISEKSGVLMS